MIALPHHPDATMLGSLRAQLAPLIAQQAAELEVRFQKGHGAFFARHAELWFIDAELEYLFEGPLPQVAAKVRVGMKHARTALELGHRSNAWHVWDYTLFSLAATYRSMAHFVATLPESQWWKAVIKPVPWLMLQNLCTFAILREDPGSPRLLQELEQAVFHTTLPPELEEDLPDIQNTCRLLQAVAIRNAPSFNRGLEVRESLRARTYSSRNQSAPIALIDLHGLGLCRLARDFEMELTAASPYLPLALLDIEPS